MTGGLILAAGMSSRMKDYKPLMDIAGAKMIHWSIRHMLEGGADCVAVVTGHQNQLLTENLMMQEWANRVRVVFNPDYENGKMFDSVQTGLRALIDCDRIYMSLADMPAISPKIYHKLQDYMDLTGCKVVIPFMDGHRRHPPLFTGTIAREILAYSGQDGLRGFWYQMEDEIHHLQVHDQGCILDADRQEDIYGLEAYLKKME